MQNVYICLYSTNISISIKTYLGPQTKMFALVLVLKKNGSTFRYLCFSGLLPTFKYLKISKHFHFQIFYIYIYIYS